MLGWTLVCSGYVHISRDKDILVSTLRQQFILKLNTQPISHNPSSASLEKVVGFFVFNYLPDNAANVWSRDAYDVGRAGKRRWAGSQAAAGADAESSLGAQQKARPD